jgi:hypothetical protein
LPLHIPIPILPPSHRSPKPSQRLASWIPPGEPVGRSHAAHGINPIVEVAYIAPLGIYIRKGVKPLRVLLSDLGTIRSIPLSRLAYIAPSKDLQGKLTIQQTIASFSRNQGKSRMKGIALERIHSRTKRTPPHWNPKTRDYDNPFIPFCSHSPPSNTILFGLQGSPFKGLNEQHWIFPVNPFRLFKYYDFHSEGRGETQLSLDFPFPSLIRDALPVG